MHHQRVAAAAPRFPFQRRICARSELVSRPSFILGGFRSANVPRTGRSPTPRSLARVPMSISSRGAQLLVVASRSGVLVLSRRQHVEPAATRAARHVARAGPLLRSLSSVHWHHGARRNASSKAATAPRMPQTGQLCVQRDGLYRRTRRQRQPQLAIAPSRRNLGTRPHHRHRARRGPRSRCCGRRRSGSRARGRRIGPVLPTGRARPASALEADRAGEHGGWPRSSWRAVRCERPRPGGCGRPRRSAAGSRRCGPPLRGASGETRPRDAPSSR